MAAARLVAIWAISLIAVLERPAYGQTADAIYIGGSILTMAGKEPAYVEALAVRDGKIVHAGTKDAALRMKGDNTKLIDLGNFNP